MGKTVASVSCSMLGPSETAARSLTGTPTCSATTTLFPRLRRRLRCHESRASVFCVKLPPTSVVGLSVAALVTSVVEYVVAASGLVQSVRREWGLWVNVVLISPVEQFDVDILLMNVHSFAGMMSY